ncbi:MAG: DUF881 domain-containing protein [Tissierella sp.]|uniref:DUF881 domain-containing protein n=1 Tax=Tissierella sp. TaxID=41274 RepID=UPI003F9995D9
MKKKSERLALVLVSVILGLILSIQFRTVNKSVGEGVLPTQRAQELASELKKVQDERDTQMNRIEELESQIKKHEKDEIDKSSHAESLYEDAMKYRTLAGYVDLEGPGIILEINDPPGDTQYSDGYGVVDQLDLILQIVSILNAADAEAISINDQRYTSFTEIVRAGDHIEINGVSTNSPLVIKAIGNPNTLESALAIKRGVVWQLKNYNYMTLLTQDKNIVIPKYRKVKELKYSSPSEEDDS